MPLLPRPSGSRLFPSRPARLLGSTLLTVSLLSVAVAGGAGPAPDGTRPAGTVLARLDRAAQPAITLEAVRAFRWADIVGLRVRVGSISAVFPQWRSMANPTFWPTLEAADLNGDGRPEVLVQLMTEQGTGVAVYQARILTLPEAGSAQLREWPVDDPLAALRARVRFSPGAVTVGGIRMLLALPDGVPAVTPRIGDQLRWTVRRGQLVAQVVVQQDWAFSGTLELSYRVQGERLVPDRVVYDPATD